MKISIIVAQSLNNHIKLHLTAKNNITVTQILITYSSAIKVYKLVLETAFIEPFFKYKNLDNFNQKSKHN